MASAQFQMYPVSGEWMGSIWVYPVWAYSIRPYKRTYLSLPDCKNLILFTPILPYGTVIVSFRMLEPKRNTVF